VAGKPCLVVGGGRIAARKAGRLLDAEADVTVVSPEASQAIKALARSGRITLAPRPFAEADVEGKCLVFATTDSKAVNRRVIESCRKRGVLCSAADGNWPHGDFVTPAICRQNGLVVTVSTGGRSCRQARIVKDKIAGLLPLLTQRGREDPRNRLAP